MPRACLILLGDLLRQAVDIIDTHDVAAVVHADDQRSALGVGVAADPLQPLAFYSFYERLDSFTSEPRPMAYKVMTRYDRAYASRERSSMVEHQLPKLTVRVRFPSLALGRNTI